MIVIEVLLIIITIMIIGIIGLIYDVEDIASLLKSFVKRQEKISNEITTTNKESDEIENEKVDRIENTTDTAIITFEPYELFDDNDTVNPKENKKPPMPKFYEEKTDVKDRIAIGNLGEKFVISYETNKLNRIGKSSFASKIKHISELYKNDKNYGYDILSYNEKGDEIYIEVKTTEANENERFFITANEYEKLNSKNNFFIYRVFNFNKETMKGQIIIIDGSKDLKKYFQLQPLQYVLKAKTNG